jgi:hypothetical protein
MLVPGPMYVWNELKPRVTIYEARDPLAECIDG